MPSYENKIVQQGVYINNHLSKNSFSQKYKSELQCELRFKMAAKEWNTDKKKNGCLSSISLSVTRTHRNHIPISHDFICKLCPIHKQDTRKMSP